MNTMRFRLLLAATAVLIVASAPGQALAPAQDRSGSASMAAVRSAMDRGDFTSARKLIQSGAAGARKSDAPKWLILEAEVEHAGKRYDYAGLAAMKAVVLYAKSDQAASGLFWAARAYEGLGRPEKAMQLYDECARHKRGLPSLREDAQRRARALRKAAAEE